MATPASVHVPRAAATGLPLVVFAHKGENWIRGSERCLLDLVARLDPERFRRLVICDAPALADAATACGADVVRLATWTRGGVGPARIRLRLRPLLRTRGAALVHANMPDVLSVTAPLARELGAPVVAHLHLPYAAFGERHRAHVRRCAAIVGVAEHVVAPLRALPDVAPRVRVSSPEPSSAMTSWRGSSRCASTLCSTSCRARGQL